MMCYEAHPVSSIVDVLLTSRSEQRGRNQGSSPDQGQAPFVTILARPFGMSKLTKIASVWRLKMERATRGL